MWTEPRKNGVFKLLNLVEHEIEHFNTEDDKELRNKIVKEKAKVTTENKIPEYLMTTFGPNTNLEDTHKRMSRIKKLLNYINIHAMEREDGLEPTVISQVTGLKPAKVRELLNSNEFKQTVNRIIPEKKGLGMLKNILLNDYTKDTDKLKALEMLFKLTGRFTDKVELEMPKETKQIEAIRMLFQNGEYRMANDDEEDKDNDE